MQTLQQIIDEILEREGERYTNRPADRGGPTKWGVTLTTLRRVWRKMGAGRPTVDDLKRLTRADAFMIFKHDYFLDHNFHTFPEEVHGLVADISVNHGQGDAAKWVQRLVGAAADGKVGPKTIAAVNRFVGAKGVRALFLGILEARFKDYAQIIHRDFMRAVREGSAIQPYKSRSQVRNINGWTNRACEFFEDIP